MGRLAVVVAALALVVAGCGGGERVVSAEGIGGVEPGVTTVYGVVTRGGEVVPGGRVSLIDLDGAERSATTGPDGAYVLADVPAGEYSLVASGESGVTCPGGCISAAWSERSMVLVPGTGLLQQDVDGD